MHSHLGNGNGLKQVILPSDLHCNDVFYIFISFHNFFQENLNTPMNFTETSSMSHMFTKKDWFQFVKRFRRYFLSSDMWDHQFATKYKNFRIDLVQDILWIMCLIESCLKFFLTRKVTSWACRLINNCECKFTIFN